MTESSVTLEQVAEKLGIGHYSRHIFLCTGDKCCSTEVGMAAWEALKKELKDRNLSLSKGPKACYRTKVGCLRVCRDGPIAVVYPEGTWYQGITADRIPLLVEQHLVNGQPVAEWQFAVNPLHEIPPNSQEANG